MQWQPATSERGWVSPKRWATWRTWRTVSRDWLRWLGRGARRNVRRACSGPPRVYSRPSAFPSGRTTRPTARSMSALWKVCVRLWAKRPSRLRSPRDGSCRPRGPSSTPWTNRTQIRPQPSPWPSSPGPWRPRRVRTWSRTTRYGCGRSLDYFYDVEAFEKNLSEARRLQAEAPDQAVLHLQQAASLYRGDFLEDIAQSEWILERQDELRRAYGESLLFLGGLLVSRERHAEATMAYRKAIAHERFSEEAHRGLMRSEAAIGERGRALRHYEDLTKMLQEQLGASPAPETVALYERLRAGE